MAKKKEQELTYMQMPLPSGRKLYKRIRFDWKGLNRQNPYDTGYISDEMNISTKEYPLLTPSPMEVITNLVEGCNVANGEEPICLIGFDDFLIFFYMHRSVSGKYDIRMAYINADNFARYETALTQLEALPSSLDRSRRQVVLFNVFEQPENVLEGNYSRKLLIFPDKRSVDYDIPSIVENDVFPTQDMVSKDEAAVPPPDMDYVTVHLSRVFGVKGGKIFASGFNDYTNWETDTPIKEEVSETDEDLPQSVISFTDGYDENNAWASASQSNSLADGDFTGLTTFQNHVVAFKRDFMHEIYNTKNPFRIQDIYAEGCIDNRSIQSVGGMLLFVSEDGVKVYTGAKPEIISNELTIDKFNMAVAGSDGRNYYLYCEDKQNKGGFYVYDTFYGLWSQRSFPARVIDFAKTKSGMYMLCDDGEIYQLDSDIYQHSWNFETDFMTAITSSYGTIDVKHIQRVQIYAQVSGTLKMYLLYDDEKFNAETSHLIFDSAGRTGNMTIRVIPRKTACFKFRLHAEGFGMARLHQLEITLENGGEPNVTQGH